jgi:hypothetical protein
MAVPETNRVRVVARLSRNGWISEGGAKQEKFAHVDKPGLKILVPRHNVLSLGVARNIAKAAGW